MTDIELVNFVFDKLVEQGGCSVDSNGECKYRGDNGRKCAAGLLIPDDEYKSEFERQNCHPYEWTASHNRPIQLEISGILVKYGYDPVKVRALQAAHDAASGSAFKTQLEGLQYKREALLKALNNGKTLDQL